MIMNSYAWDIYGMLCKNFENMIEILMHIYIYILDLRYDISSKDGWVIDC